MTILALLAVAVIAFAFGALCEQAFDVTFHAERWLEGWRRRG